MLNSTMFFSVGLPFVKKVCISNWFLALYFYTQEGLYFYGILLKVTTCVSDCCGNDWVIARPLQPSSSMPSYRRENGLCKKLNPWLGLYICPGLCQTTWALWPVAGPAISNGNSKSHKAGTAAGQRLIQVMRLLSCCSGTTWIYTCLLSSI